MAIPRSCMAAGQFLAALLVCISAASANTWQTVCNKQKCQLYNAIVKTSDKTVLARLVLEDLARKRATGSRFAAKRSKLVGVVSLPLGLYIPSGVAVSIDKKPVFKAVLVDCGAQEGCRAAFDVTPRIANAMKRGGAMSFQVVDGRSRRTLSFNFSLIGFTVAYNRFVKPP